MSKYSANKRSFVDLLKINALTCGLEIISSCAYTYVPPMLLKAGYTETAMTIILGIAPVLDLVTVPMLADWSDLCTSPMGRRRPFIIFLSSIVLFSLVLISSSPQISFLMTNIPNHPLNMLLLAFGVVLLDYSYQALFNPCEALLSDLLASENSTNQTLGFTIHSAFISLGCVLGYIVVYIDWAYILNTNVQQAQICFLISLVLFFPCLFFTLSNKETPISPRRITLTKLQFPFAKKAPMNQLAASPRLIKIEQYGSISDTDCESNSDIDIDFMQSNVFPSSHWMEYSLCVSMKHQLMISINLIWRILLSVLMTPVMILKLFFGCFVRMRQASVVVQRLFMVELFGWIALVCHNYFFCDFVGQYIYKGNPSAVHNSTEAILYDTGVRMGSIGLLFHSIVACLYAFVFQEHLIRLIGHRRVFIGELVLFSVGMILTVFSSSIAFLHSVTAIAGIGFAALTTTPYVLITLYYQNKKIYMEDNFKDLEDDANYISRGIGAEVAVLDMAFYLSQIFISFTVGPLVDLTGSPLPTMIVAALASCVTTFFALRVVFDEGHMKLLTQGQF